jgi:nucleotide-binding universal stress UspA family protein
MFPPRIILAAVDFSEPSRVALACAARFAKQCGAELHVLHAEDPMLANAARAAGIDISRETRDELAAFMRSAAPAGDWAPLHHVVGGSAVDVICDSAQREGAGLIVLGMHGMSGVERMMFGSTTEGVLRKAPTSVLVVPDKWTAPRADLLDLTGAGPVVVALDLSMAALAAASAAWRLAALLRTSVDAVHVVAALPVPERWSRHAEAAVRQRIEATRAELTSALHHLGAEVPVNLHIETGRVAERIAETVGPTPEKHPILVLGRRAQSEQGAPPGSTAYRILTIAEVPVLMYLQDE